mmetsp:Transcript_34213/g.89606  ORF Transcript_34213/g.89606 Transcript_34213/m.89606 type:complete len:218 (+) Transcript_34213:522-1175(+)
MGRALHGGPRQRLRRVQGEREQEADGHGGPERPLGRRGEPVCDHDDQLVPLLPRAHVRHRGEKVWCLPPTLQDEQDRLVEHDRVGSLVLRLQRARDNDHQEDERSHPVRRQHREARHRHRGRRHHSRGEPRPAEADRLRHRHRRRVPLLDHRRPREVQVTRRVAPARSWGTGTASLPLGLGSFSFFRLCGTAAPCRDLLFTGESLHGQTSRVSPSLH